MGPFIGIFRAPNNPCVKWRSSCRSASWSRTISFAQQNWHKKLMRKHRLARCSFRHSLSAHSWPSTIFRSPLSMSIFGAQITQLTRGQRGVLPTFIFVNWKIPDTRKCEEKSRKTILLDKHKHCRFEIVTDVSWLFARFIYSFVGVVTCTLHTHSDACLLFSKSISVIGFTQAN